MYTTSRNIMDARDWDRISDLLCQIRGKIENNLVTTHTQGHFTKHHYLMMVYDLINYTDEIAELQIKGVL